MKNNFLQKMKDLVMNNQVQIVYGYARVSSLDQNLDRQLIALRSAGVPEKNIFADKKSGKDFIRPAWNKLTRKLRAGDLLIVKSIDRFGRNYEEIIAVWSWLSKRKKIHLRVLDMPLLDTTTAHGLLAVFIANIVLQILSFAAEIERVNIRERQREGIKAAKARGIKFGRPQIKPTSSFREQKEKYKNNEQSLRLSAEACGMSVTSFWRKCKQPKE